jgi:hypothetical protein
MGECDRSIIIAAAPRSQAALAERLLGDGYRPVRFDDVVQD